MVGSVDTAEFVVAVGASLGFLIALGSQGIDWALRRRAAGRRRRRRADRRHPGPLPAARVLGVAAGGLIVLTNLKTLAEVVGVPGDHHRAARVDGLHPLGAVGRVGGQARAGRPRGRRHAPQDRVRAHVAA